MHAATTPTTPNHQPEPAHTTQHVAPDTTAAADVCPNADEVIAALNAVPGAQGEIGGLINTLIHAATHIARGDHENGVGYVTTVLASRLSDARLEHEILLAELREERQIAMRAVHADIAEIVTRSLVLLHADRPAFEHVLESARNWTNHADLSELADPLVKRARWHRQPFLGLVLGITEEVKAEAARGTKWDTDNASAVNARDELLEDWRKLGQRLLDRPCWLRDGDEDAGPGESMIAIARHVVEPLTKADDFLTPREEHDLVVWTEAQVRRAIAIGRGEAWMAIWWILNTNLDPRFPRTECGGDGWELCDTPEEYQNAIEAIVRDARRFALAACGFAPAMSYVWSNSPNDEGLKALPSYTKDDLANYCSPFNNVVPCEVDYAATSGHMLATLGSSLVGFNDADAAGLVESFIQTEHDGAIEHVLLPWYRLGLIGWLAQVALRDESEEGCLARRCDEAPIMPPPNEPCTPEVTP